MEMERVTFGVALFFLFGSRRTPERVGDFLGNLPGGQIRGENDGVGMHNLLVHSSVKC